MQYVVVLDVDDEKAQEFLWDDSIEHMCRALNTAIHGDVNMTFAELDAIRKGFSVRPLSEILAC